MRVAIEDPDNYLKWITLWVGPPRTLFKTRQREVLEASDGFGIEWHARRIDSISRKDLILPYQPRLIEIDTMALHDGLHFGRSCLIQACPRITICHVGFDVEGSRREPGGSLIRKRV